VLGGDVLNGTVEKYDIKSAPVSDEEIDFLAEIFMGLIRKEEQHGDNDEKI
jgi:hypothetical protein